MTSSDALLAQLDATRRDLAPIVLIVQHDDEVMGTDNAVVLMNRVAELAAALKAVLELCEGSHGMRPPFHRLVSADEVVRVIAEQLESL